MNFFKTGLIFTPEMFILFEKVWGPKGAGEREFCYTNSRALNFL